MSWLNINFLLFIIVIFIVELCFQALTSDNIKKIFGLILAIGNYMNGGNRTRGQADGFGLEILPKIKDVKSKDSNYTLLHFIVNKYIEVKFDVFSITN